MRRHKALCALAALLLLCAGALPRASAEARSLYIGDVITLEIAAQRLTEDALLQAFHDFEIVEIKKEAEAYLVSIRSFDVGEKTVRLGDKEIVVTVDSTLADLQRDEPFEGEAWVIAPGFPFHWRILFYASAGVFALTGGCLLAKPLLKRKRRPEKAYRAFVRHAASLSTEDENFLVKLTHRFKTYLESLCGRRMIGNTSAEIMAALEGVRSAKDMLFEVQAWLTECDRLKFTGVEVSADTMRGHRELLLGLAERMERSRCAMNEGTP